MVEASVTNEDRIELRNLGLSDKDIDEITVMLDGIVSTKQEEIEKIYSNEWHKGEYCEIIEGICQEGACNRCEPYLIRNIE